MFFTIERLGQNYIQNNISKRFGLIQTKLGGCVGLVTRRQFDFGPGPDPDPVHQWDAKTVHSGEGMRSTECCLSL